MPSLSARHARWCAFLVPFAAAAACGNDAAPALTAMTPASPACSVVSLGGSSGCAVLADGRVACWGLDTYGELGIDAHGADHEVHRPTLVSGLSGATAVASRGNFACALLATGEVACWGINGSGQLGNEQRAPSYVPTAVHGPKPGEHLTGVKAIAVGTKHACAVTSEGLLYCWGANGFGQLGNGKGGDEDIASLAEGSGYVDVAVGRDHTCALRSDGTVWCAGRNEMGELGMTAGDSSPKMVQARKVSGVRTLSAGDRHTCALLSDGSASCWGPGLSGETTSPKGIAFEAVKAGGAFSCGVTAAGDVHCWGDNSAQQIAPRSAGSVASAEVGAIGKVAALALGRTAACATTVEGHVECWGDNHAGELGTGIASSAVPPTAFNTLDLTGLAARPAAGSP